jgi:hypothetical protein
LSIASAACCAIVRDRLGGIQRDDRELGEEVGRRRDRDERRRRALLEERAQQRVGAAEARDGGQVEEQRRVGARGPRLGPLEDRAHRGGEPRLGDVDRARHELVAALVGDADHGGVDAELPDEGLRDGGERRVERERLRERPRDLVERRHLPRRRPLRLEDLRELGAELGRALVQPRVLDGDRELRRERAQQRHVSFGKVARARVGDQEADRLLAHLQRHRDGGRLRGRCERRPDRRERRLDAADVRVERRARAQRAGERLGRALGDLVVPARDAAAGGREQPSVLAEVDADLVDLQELGDSLDGRLERVRERETGDRLADDLEERPRPLEIELERARPVRRLQRVRGARRESGERRQIVGVRHRFRRVEELQRRERRLAERKGGDVLQRSGQRLLAGDRGRPPRLEHLARDRGGGGQCSLDLADARQPLGHVAGDAPQDTAARTGRLGGDPHGLVPGAAHVAAGRECLARELEPGRTADAGAGDERPDGQPDLRRHELDDCAVAVSERLLPHDLDGADDATARACHLDGRSGCVRALGRPRDRLRELTRLEPLRRDARAGDLGSERRAVGRRGARDEVSLVVDDAQDDEVGARRLGGAGRERRERRPQVAGRSDPARGFGERLHRQSLGFDGHR